MLSMRLLSRGSVPQYAATVQRLHTSTILFNSSSSSSDSDKKNSKQNRKAKPVVSSEQKLKSRQETTDRMNNLVNGMMMKSKSTKSIDLAVPFKKREVGGRVKNQPYEKKIIEAAKDVATSLGGDVKKTESELLNKLLAVKNDKSDEQGKDEPKSAPASLKDCIMGMQIDRTPEEPIKFVKNPWVRDGVSTHRSARVKGLAKQFQSLDSRTSNRRRTERTGLYTGPVEPGNLYGGDTLDIFDLTKTRGEAVDAPRLTTWEILEKKEFKLALIHPPENIFQEMIMWTEQGKLWKFPIDNEQGLEEEQSIHFSEHVFMERHLKDWCPKAGPIRHFMQLVCVGLSKNPYMTVREKQEHIFWYRDYFASKQELLKEIGAIETEIPQTKQIAT